MAGKGFRFFVLTVTTASVLAACGGGASTEASDSTNDLNVQSTDSPTAPTTSPEAPITTAMASTTTTTPTTTAAPTTTMPPRPGVLVMEFGEWLLTLPIDECPLFAKVGYWSLPQDGVERVPVENIDGTIWEIEVSVGVDGNLHTIAAAPGGKPFYIGNSSKVDVGVEVTDQEATFVTTFVNAVFDGPDELDATITIICEA